MKKLALVLAVVMVLSLGLTACGGSTSSTGTASSAPAGSSSSGSASDAAPAYNPDALQVKALDDNTLQVTLTARTPYFLELTAFPAYAPVQQATVEANGEAWAVDAAPAPTSRWSRTRTTGTWTAWLARTPCSSR